ncbi:crotonase/enoyl-CoA hydratase family protein [Pseudonocardia sp. KRD291]|uniref:crotonase/enoyl-CoA hydratase family protein n=1 Tax=Pseudonocardia sp. KRD291 TaxID=2792007 RepID=UPI001C49F442|nr:crotonase/enoyl-CoA hydratase family protein [Pseudonocardia sp. KRD291]MBW0101048.1 crotonase/enoyl-CoA hydratase family protein [Pseudonocardia sp. KRD291]
MNAAPDTTTATTGDPAVLVERDDHVQIITLNRPEAMNAVNRELAQLLGEAVEEAEHDSEVRAVVLTGAGGRAFCAGADLKAVARGEDIGVPGREAWGFAGYVTHPISKPTIAAVTGFALGGGTELSLASDLVVAGRSSRFGLPEVRRGIIAAAGGIVRLPEQLPRKVAMQMVLTGDPIDADTAHRWGLVNDVVDDTEVLATAVALARRIAENAPVAVQASKRVVAGITDGTVPAEADAWARNSAAIARVMASEDAREGPRAFAENRPPRWQGR